MMPFLAALNPGEGCMDRGAGSGFGLGFGAGAGAGAGYGVRGAGCGVFGVMVRLHLGCMDRDARASCSASTYLDCFRRAAALLGGRQRDSRPPRTSIRQRPPGPPSSSRQSGSRSPGPLIRQSGSRTRTRHQIPPSGRTGRSFLSLLPVVI